MISVVLQLCTWTPSDRESLRTLAFEHSCREKKQQAWNWGRAEAGERREGKRERLSPKWGTTSTCNYLATQTTKTSNRKKSCLGWTAEVSHSAPEASKGVRRANCRSMCQPAPLGQLQWSITLFPALSFLRWNERQEKIGAGAFTSNTALHMLPKKKTLADLFKVHLSPPRLRKATPKPFHAAATRWGSNYALCFANVFANWEHTGKSLFAPTLSLKV